MTANLRVALGEYNTGWQQPEASLDRAAACVQRAASTGARLVVLPEMCTTGFTMASEEWAEPTSGASLTALAELARRHDLWLIAGIATREHGVHPEVHRNVAAVIDPSGTLVASYAKQRLFAFAGEHEHYAEGSEHLTVDIDGVRVTPLICYDLRFPELFRDAALETELFVVIANWPAVRRPHWDVLLPARAIENQAYVVGVNRTGEGGGVSYDGGSAAYDPWGTPAAVRVAVAAPLIVDVSTARVESVRAQYPFLADKRAEHSSMR